MNQKKLAASFVICVISMFMMGITCFTAHANVYNENEPNDSMKTAEAITANKVTAQETVSGSFAGESVVSGITDNSDPDWFVVYLKAGTQYLTCNGQMEYTYSVKDSFGINILTGTYKKNGLYATAYKFNVPAEGYYFVEIIGLSTVQEKYVFSIGGPTYYVASAKIACQEGMINMNSSIATGHFNASSYRLPKDAIVYDLNMSGVTSTAVNTIQLTNEVKRKTLNLSPYIWSASGLEGMNLPVSSMWTAKFSYKKTTSFTPALQLYYVYPLYDRPVS